MNFAQAFNPWAQFAQMGGLPGNPGGLGGLGGINAQQGLGATPIEAQMAEMMQRWAQMMSQGGQNVAPFQSFGAMGSPVFRPDNQLAGQGPRNGLAGAIAPMGMMGRS